LIAVSQISILADFVRIVPVVHAWQDAEAERDFARCLELDPDLKASLTSRIDEAKRQRSAIH
jgi:hypothetical protein